MLLPTVQAVSWAWNKVSFDFRYIRKWFWNNIWIDIFSFFLLSFTIGSFMALHWKTSQKLKALAPEVRVTLSNFDSPFPFFVRCFSSLRLSRHQRRQPHLNCLVLGNYEPWEFPRLHCANPQPEPLLWLPHHQLLREKAAVTCSSIVSGPYRTIVTTSRNIILWGVPVLKGPRRKANWLSYGTQFIC